MNLAMHRWAAVLLVALLQDPPSLKEALKDQAADFWIYDNLEAGQARARESGKPLLVSLRCVP